MPDFSFTYKNGAVLEYDVGNFDAWCVYLTRPDGKRIAPRDREYFSRIKDYDKVIGGGAVYKDLVRIYNKTNNVPNPLVLEKIEEYCHRRYDACCGSDYATSMAIDYGIIYMGMVAEENKKNSVLGKRVKRLGFHQVLVENMDCSCAASYSKGVKSDELDKLCKKYGF